VTFPLRDLRTRAYWQGDAPSFDARALVSTEPNRWNDEEVAAVYLAGDIGLTLVEAGRHMADQPERTQTRVIWTVNVNVSGIVDLRSRAVRAELSLVEEHWFLDRARCRTVVAAVRESSGVSGLLVPSAGMPDDHSRWNLVLYPDRLTRPLPAIVVDPSPVGSLGVEGARAFGSSRQAGP
jgi:RES domain-containing protein